VRLASLKRWMPAWVPVWIPGIVFIGSNALSAALLLYAIAVQPALRNFLLFYSDNVTLAVYMESVLRGEAISGFHYGTQGFFFTGYILYPISYLLALAFPGDPFAASLIIKAILQVLCFNLAILYLACSVLRNKRRALYYASTSTLVLTLILLLGQHLTLEGWFPTVLFLTSTHHIGVAIGIPLFFAGVINYFHSRKSGNLVFAVAISAVLWPTSGVWPIWFLIPFLLALTILFVLNHIERKFYAIVTLCTILSAVIGWALNRAARQFFAVTNPGSFEFDRFQIGLRGFRATLENVYLQNWPLTLALIIMAVLCCIGIFFLGKMLYQSSRLESGNKSRRPTDSPLLLILTYSLLAGIIITLVAIFIGRADIMRYYSLFVVFSLFGMLPLFTLSVRKFQVAAGTIIALLGLAVATSPLYLMPETPFSNPAELRASDYVYQVAQKDLPGDFIGEFWTIVPVGLYTDALSSRINPNLRLRPILQNVDDADRVNVQNLIMVEGDSGMMRVLEGLPDYSSKHTFMAHINSNVKAPIIIYHWDEPVNQYLTVFDR